MTAGSRRTMRQVDVKLLQQSGEIVIVASVPREWPPVCRQGHDEDDRRVWEPLVVWLDVESMHVLQWRAHERSDENQLWMFSSCTSRWRN